MNWIEAKVAGPREEYVNGDDRPVHKLCGGEHGKQESAPNKTSSMVPVPVPVPDKTAMPRTRPANGSSLTN